MLLRTPILIAATLAATILPAVAAAAAPIKETTVSGSFVVSEESCGFAVAVEPRQDKLRIFTFSNGRQIITGSYLATATNVETGKTLDVNLSGQAFFKPNPDGGGTFTTTGTTLFFLPGSLQLIRGPLVLEFDANGDATITIVSSSVTDVCTVLSDP